MLEQFYMALLVGAILSIILCSSVRGAFSLVWYCQTHDNLITEAIRFIGVLIMLAIFMVVFYVIR